MTRTIVAGLAVLAWAGMALAQRTGPQGLAEPRYPPAAVGQASLVPPPLTPANTLNLDLSSGGRVVIQLRPDKAPNSVARIKTLVERHFYDGLTFHRVIEGFMAQGGDPKGDGSGGSELPDLRAEFNDLPHVRGSLAMARAESPDSANSQFYIMLAPNLALDKRYTVVGRVVSGMAFVDALEKGEPPANPSKIVNASLGAPSGIVATPAPAARAAASAAAGTASQQAAAASLAADEAAKAAAKGDAATAGERAAAAKTAAEGAAQAAGDAAEAAKAAGK